MAFYHMKRFCTVLLEGEIKKYKNIIFYQVLRKFYASICASIILYMLERKRLLDSLAQPVSVLDMAPVIADPRVENVI